MNSKTLKIAKYAAVCLLIIVFDYGILAKNANRLEHCFETAGPAMTCIVEPFLFSGCDDINGHTGTRYAERCKQDLPNSVSGKQRSLDAVIPEFRLTACQAAGGWPY